MWWFWWSKFHFDIYTGRVRNSRCPIHRCLHFPLYKMQIATNRFKKSTEHQVWNKSINKMACPVLSRPRPRSRPSLVAPAGRPPSAGGRPGGSLKAFDWVVGELTTDENGPRRQETACAGPGPGQLDGLAMDWSVFFSLPRSQFMFGQLMLFPLTFPFSSFL